MKQASDFRLSYHVSPQEYVSLLAAQYRAKRNRPLSLGLFLLSTLGQVALVLWCILRRVITGKAVLWMVLLSCALALLAVLNRYSSTLRARSQYAMLKKAGKSPVESGRRWTLEIHGDGSVFIDVDSKTARVSADQLHPVSYEGAGMGVFSGGKMLTFIPEKAFSGVDSKEKLVQCLSQAAQNCYVHDAEEIQAEIPGELIADFHRTISGEEFLTWSRRAYRAIYKTRLGWPPVVLIRLAIGAAAVAYALLNPSWLALPAAAALCIVLNFHFIRSFTPLINRAILAPVQELKDKYPDHRARFSFGEDAFVISGAMHAMKIPYADIADIRLFGDFAGFYLKKSMVIVVPRGAGMPEDEFTRLIARIRTHI